LILFRQQKAKGYVETKQIYGLVKSASPTAELTRLKYLGLIEHYFTEEDYKKESKRSGKWIVTQNGIDFILKKGTAPIYVEVQNEKVFNRAREVYIDDPNLQWHKEKDIWEIMQEYWKQ
jgi:hypothetical protein